MSKYGRQAENGVVLITTNKNEIMYALPDSTLQPMKDRTSGCTEDAVIPVFPGGEEKLVQYITDSIQYPFVAKRTKTQGKVYVRFLVDSLGKVSDVTSVRSIDYFLGKEALRVVKTLPDWTPGMKCGKKLNFYITMPVTFKLDEELKDKKEWVRNDKTIVLLDGERLPASFELEWLRYENLTSYQVFQPTSKEVTKKLVSQYGRDAANGVILISSRKQNPTDKK
jgi:TonB family protein